MGQFNSSFVQRHPKGHKEKEQEHVIVKKDKEIKRKHKEIKDHKAAIKKKQLTIESQGKLIKEKDQAIKVQVKAIQQKNKEVEERTIAIKKKDKLIETQTKNVQNKEEQINSNLKLLKKKEKELKNNIKLMKQKDAAVSAALKAHSTFVKTNTNTPTITASKHENKESKPSLINRIKNFVAPTETKKDLAPILADDGTQVKLEEAAKKLQDQMKIIKEKDKVINSQVKVIKEKDNKVKAQLELLKKKEDETNTKIKSMNKINADDKSKERLLHEKDATIKAQQKLMKEKDAAIKAQSVLTKEKSSTIDKQIEVMQERVSAMVSQVEIAEGKDEKIKKQIRLLQEKEAIIKEQNKLLRAKESTIKKRSVASTMDKQKARFDYDHNGQLVAVNPVSAAQSKLIITEEEAESLVATSQQAKEEKLNWMIQVYASLKILQNEIQTKEARKRYGAVLVTGFLAYFIVVILKKTVVNSDLMIPLGAFLCLSLHYVVDKVSQGIYNYLKITKYEKSFKKLEDIHNNRDNDDTKKE